MPDRAPLPIDDVLPDLLSALAGAGAAVLQAPPGAGKTTRVPLALLDTDWLAGSRIVMLEPRRLAARAAAARMAATLGEAVGDTVGYRVRMDSRVGPRTRIEVVTEGIFLRQIQADPELTGIGAVLFDEFHERNLDADLSLALALEVQAAFRPELRLVAMSATLDGGPVAALLGGAPLVTSEGRAHPVETRFAEPAAGERIEAAAARTIRRALAEEPGGILAFLPGRGEIGTVHRLLGEAGVPAGTDVVQLHGDLSLDAQDAAIRPAPAGRRKVVLATAIAETSLTIEGVRIVVDSGLARQTRFDPRSGMDRLETSKVSRASADQRRGRAGRLEPGICYRLWSEPADRALVAHTPPEIQRADLVPLALELARWGAGADALRWLDPPPAPALAQGRELLRRLGALDDDGRLTDHGRAMADLGVHPRLAHMLQRAVEEDCVPLACRVAALLTERDPLRTGPHRRADADLRSRLDLLDGDRDPTADRRTLARIRDSARDLQRRLPRGRAAADAGFSPGRLLAMAYPDRVAQRRGPGQFRLSNGRGAALDQADPLAAADLLAIADLDAQGANARVFLAAPLTREELEAEFGDQIVTLSVVEWDAREQAVLARRRRSFNAVVLQDDALSSPPADARLAAMLEGIRQMGPACLPWSAELERWRERVAFLRREDGERWPDLSDAALMNGLEDWLAPFLGAASRRSHLAGIDLSSAVHGRLDWSQRQELDRLAPSHVTVPSGSRIPVDYSGDVPVLAVRLQEMFGLAQTPAVLGGRMPLLLHLLSPAQRPVQVTRDLAGFWANSYREVRKDLAGRYPKHVWPDDPLAEAPTARAKPRR